MIDLRAAADRYRTDQPGITTWHSFAAGPHYDPANLSFGALVGVDEHHVGAGAGFDWHGHRGVHIVSTVLAGVLRHEDRSGSVLRVGPGRLLVQSAGAGISHRETNAADEGLVLVQTTVLASAAARVEVTSGPVLAGSATVALGRAGAYRGPAHVFVLHGELDWQDVALRAGDALRVPRGERALVGGSGELLVVTVAG